MSGSGRASGRGVRGMAALPALFFLIGLLGSLGSPARADERSALSRDAWEGWLALLHYRSDGAGGWQSEVPTRSFFLDADGDVDPEREWEAARRAFLRSAGAAADDPAQCRFPARFAFMKEQLGWTERDAPTVACPGFAAFEQKLGARTVSVVFASHFLANPASAFGHTMLHLGRSRPPGQLEPRLADASIGFEADTKGLSAAKYIPRGLRGELVAGFRVIPFYDRVRKYERQELRDLWLFPLQLSQREIDQLVRHLWELQPVSYRYGFFGENCAQKMLALLHAVVPRHHLLPYDVPAILPSEVVRRMVTSIGLRHPPLLRASLSGRYGRARDALSGAERDLLDAMIEARSVVPGASAAVLSAAILWAELELPYRTFRRAADAARPDAPEHPDLRWKRALLFARSAQADAAGAGEATPADTSETWRPSSEPSLLDAHAPTRLTVRGGVRDGTAAFGAGMRWLLHEPLDPDAGYPRLSSLEVARVDLGVTADGDGFVDEATAIRLEKLAPASSLQSPIAWKLEAGARRLPCEDGPALHAGAEAAIGLGATLARSSRRSMAMYLLLGARPGVTFSVTDGVDSVRFAPLALASAGVVLRVAGLRARLGAETSLSLRSLAFESAATAALRLGLGRDLDLELLSTKSQDTATAALGLVFFR
jgi:Domain of unknown function (DUF4105)